MANKINIDAIINAHPGWSTERLAARYAQTANECENKHYLGAALPKDGHSDNWLNRAETAKQVAAELRNRTGV